MRSKQHSSINCPNCGENIELGDVFIREARASIQKEYEEKHRRNQWSLAEERKSFELEQRKFQEKKKVENEMFQQRLHQQLEKEKKGLEQRAREDVAVQLQHLKQELTRKADENAQLKKLELEFLKREHALKELADQQQIKAEKNFLLKKSEFQQEVVQQEKEKNELKYREYEKQLNDQKKLIEEMKRKAEQGSMQLQGEVQELAVEDFLRANFPLDDVLEIKKGARGGDCLQRVNTRSRPACGTIYYESKRTKDFQPNWIEKFKNDIRSRGADIGVLVTTARPKNFERMGLLDGVWVCSFEEFKGLAAVLRQTLIKVSQAKSMEENKGEKKTMLYNYFTSNEFRLQMEGIIEAFQQMQLSLEKEKTAAHRNWKEREKQLEKALLNAAGFYGSARGIVGASLKEIPLLETGEATLFD